MARTNRDQSWLNRWLKVDTQEPFSSLPIVQPTVDVDQEWPLPIELVNRTEAFQALGAGTNTVDVVSNTFDQHALILGFHITFAVATLAVQVYLVSGPAPVLGFALYNGAAAGLHFFNTSIYFPPEWTFRVLVLGAAGAEAYNVNLRMLRRDRSFPLEFGGGI